MNHNPYECFDKDDLILRDVLAADRTILANERTFLAYIRTALTFSLAGATILKIFPKATVPMKITAWVFIPVGIIVFIVGLIRFISMQKAIGPVKKRPWSKAKRGAKNVSV